MSSKLIVRTASALTALCALFMTYFFYSMSGVYFLSSLVFIAMAYECGSMCFQKKISLLFLLPIHALFFAIYFFNPRWEFLCLATLVELILWLWLQRSPNTSTNTFYSEQSKIFQFLFYTLIAPTFILAHFVALPEPKSIFFLLFVVAAFDSLSYFWGKALGGKIFDSKLFPLTSPSKTFEGAVLAALTCLPLTLFADQKLPSYSIFTHFESPFIKAALTLAILLAALSGDLYESALKRASGKKDSGSLLPGHGGFFDRLDGMLFAGILSYIILQF
jgi:phosphatidate cytidylyltransferase